MAAISLKRLRPNDRCSNFKVVRGTDFKKRELVEKHLKVWESGVKRSKDSCKNTCNFVNSEILS